jgi:hypothetical protein
MSRLALHTVREAVLESPREIYRHDWACILEGAVKISAAVGCATGGSLYGQEEEKDAGYSREDHQAC